MYNIKNAYDSLTANDLEFAVNEKEVAKKYGISRNKF